MKPLLVVLALAAACSPDAPVVKAVEPARDAPKPAPARDAPRPTPAAGEVDLAFTGALTRDVHGPVATCGYTDRGDGKIEGGTWKLATDDFELAILATSDAELAAPSVILNVREPERVSYALRGSDGIKLAADRTVADLDLTLKNIVGSDTVQVKGTITCPPLAR